MELYMHLSGFGYGHPHAVSLSGANTMMLPVLLVAALVCTIAPSVAQDPDHPPVDQELPDEEVLRLVRPDYPGFENLAAAMKARDLARAHRLLAQHFAARERPFVPEAKFPGITEGNSMVKLRRISKQRADEKILKHIFAHSNNDKGITETYPLDPVINWMENPSEGFTWNLYLNQLNMLPQLAYVYRQAGDEKYAVEAGNLLTSWVEQMWRGYCYVRNGKIVNSGMEVRNRLCNCMAAYEVLRKSPSLTPDMHMGFWKLFISHARDLMTYSGVSYPGLIAAAVLFPEFREAPQWLAQGEKSLRNSLVERVTPEGAWDTHSISYQNVPTPWAMRCLEIIEANPGSGDCAELAAMIKEQTGKLMRIMLWLTMPNGGLPNIGDTYGRHDWGTAIGKVLTSYIHSQVAPEQQERINAIDSTYDRAKAALALYEGHAGPQPRTTSIGFPGTGYYVMRSGWEAMSARYLYFDLSPQAMGHAHYDACHFDLYAYGKPLLVDTGDYFLGWGYRTALHNDIEVDEKMSRWGAEVMPCEWLTTDHFGFVDGAHAGFEDTDIVRRRKLFFVKASPDGFADYWILCDLLNGTGRHKCEQFFHFAGPTQHQGAEAVLNDNTLATSTTHADTANVQVIPAYTDGMGAGFVQAQETDLSPKDKMTRSAMLGWIVTDGTFRRAKSAVAVYAREGDLPVSFYDVLFPTAQGATAQVTITTFPVTAGGTELDPTQAAGLRIDCVLARPVHDPSSIEADLGVNLAAKMPSSVEVSEGEGISFSAGAAGRLTDGRLGVTEIAAAASSAPYTPGKLLAGRFVVDFGQPTQVNMIIAHHGTFNGNAIIYPPTEMTVQYWDDQQWQDTPNAETTWQPHRSTRTCFDTVTTSRIAVRVERPEGGRLAMREIEAYHVTDAEIKRFAALRAERVSTSWTDHFLIAHEGAGERRYGDLLFDGELALIRRDAQGQLLQASIKNGSVLRQGDQPILSAPNPVDYLTARWHGDTVSVECPSSGGLQLTSPGARKVLHDGRPMASSCIDSVLTIAATPSQAAPQVTDVVVRLAPPQHGLHGAQPWATVTWRTNTAATTQVQFWTDDGPIRRTPLDTQLAKDHRARVEFLRPGKQYQFRAISSDASGRRAESMAEQRCAAAAREPGLGCVTKALKYAEPLIE